MKNFKNKTWMMNFKRTIWMMNSKKTNLNELDGVFFGIVVENIKLERNMVFAILLGSCFKVLNFFLKEVLNLLLCNVRHIVYYNVWS